GQLARPAGHLDAQVMAGCRGQPVPGGAQHEPVTVRADLVTSSGNRHDSTVGHMWGERPAIGAEAAVQCSGTWPNTSWIRLRSRSRGWVAPPTQRLTVFTDTPSCRAAASWVIPSRRSALDIHSANEAGCWSAAGSWAVCGAGPAGRAGLAGTGCAPAGTWDSE